MKIVRIIKYIEAAVNLSGQYQDRRTADAISVPCCLQVGGIESILGNEGIRAAPRPNDPALTERVAGTDHNGDPVEAHVVVERPLTLF